MMAAAAMGGEQWRSRSRWGGCSWLSPQRPGDGVCGPGNTRMGLGRSRVGRRRSGRASVSPWVRDGLFVGMGQDELEWGTLARGRHRRMSHKEGGEGNGAELTVDRHGLALPLNRRPFVRGGGGLSFSSASSCVPTLGSDPRLNLPPSPQESASCCMSCPSNRLSDPIITRISARRPTDEQCSGMSWRLPAGSSGQCCDGYVCESVDAFFGSCVLAASVHKELGPIAAQTAVSIKPLPEGQGMSIDDVVLTG